MLAKILVSIAIFVSLASASEVVDSLKAAASECAKTHHIDKVYISSILEDKMTPPLKMESPPPVCTGGYQILCFVECVMEKFGLIVDGKVNLARSLELYAVTLKDFPEIIDEAAKIEYTCSKEVIKSAEKCSYGVDLLACAFKHGQGVAFPNHPINL